jgi:hypothetical protein
MSVPQEKRQTMIFPVGVALGWLGVGCLVAAAVLIEHLLSVRRFPERAGWWLIPALIIAWPWPVWVWYATRIAQSGPTGGRQGIVLVTIVLIGALGSGWAYGLNLYGLLYPKEPELPSTAAIGTMAERDKDAELASKSNAQNEQLDKTRVESILLAPTKSRRETRRNGNPKTSSRPGTNPWGHGICPAWQCASKARITCGGGFHAGELSIRSYERLGWMIGRAVLCTDVTAST